MPSTTPTSPGSRLHDGRSGAHGQRLPLLEQPGYQVEFSKGSDGIGPPSDDHIRAGAFFFQNLTAASWLMTF